MRWSSGPLTGLVAIRGPGRATDRERRKNWHAAQCRGAASSGRAATHPQQVTNLLHREGPSESHRRVRATAGGVATAAHQHEGVYLWRAIRRQRLGELRSGGLVAEDQVVAAAGPECCQGAGDSRVWRYVEGLGEGAVGRSALERIAIHHQQAPASRPG